MEENSKIKIKRVMKVIAHPFSSIAPSATHAFKHKCVNKYENYILLSTS